MEITLELDTRNHERQKEKNNHQEKKTDSSKSSSSHPQYFSNSNHKKKNFNFQKRDTPHSSFLNKEFKLMGSEKAMILKEGSYAYCGGNHSLQDCIKRPQNQLTQPAGRFSSKGKA
ncbi:hypothetical protein O181_084432 [Austropuccinia psidii MF-1]|uniref:Uncharacterized protein n=1 Tax=Austropuccinia psidii MF-1 TaxID=1389203 RepID=A0A9Q3FU94_9BASI|nr:hypothetical protein [Austropuccinia psidii MF-1]